MVLGKKKDLTNHILAENFKMYDIDVDKAYAQAEELEKLEKRDKAEK